MPAYQSSALMTRRKFFLQNFFLNYPSRIQFKEKFWGFVIQYLGWRVTQGNPAQAKTFLKWKKSIATSILRVFFVLKPGENSFSLWPVWIRFGNVGRLRIAHAIFRVCAPDYRAIQVCPFLQWLCNAIGCNFNISLLPNFWTQAQNIALFGTEFDAKNWTDLDDAHLIFGVCWRHFGAAQVCLFAKCLWKNIWYNSKIKPCRNFENHAEII